MEERFFIGGESKGGYGSRSSEGPVPARRSRRLISDTEFRNVQKMGKSRVDGLLVLRFRPNQEEFPRWGILVSRRVGGAVVRNKVKRSITLITLLEMMKVVGLQVLEVMRSLH